MFLSRWTEVCTQIGPIEATTVEVGCTKGEFACISTLIFAGTAVTPFACLCKVEQPG